MTDPPLGLRGLYSPYDYLLLLLYVLSYTPEIYVRVHERAPIAKSSREVRTGIASDHCFVRTTY